MTRYTKRWLIGLAGGFIGGMAASVDSALALMIMVPREFNLGPQLWLTIKTAFVLGVLTGVKVMCAYLKKSPLPLSDEEK